jgi:hypothetical protein
MVNVHIAKVIEHIKMKKITILLLLILCSCGTRKTDTTQNENIKIENQYNTGSKIVLGNTFTYKPFDPLKVMVLDGKKYENAIVSNDKSITKTNWNTKYVNTTITKYRTKQTEKSDNTFLYIGLFLVSVLGILAWFKLPSFK